MANPADKQLFETLKAGRKKVVAAAAIITALTVGAGTLTAFSLSGKTEESPENLYKETKVTRGDIVVGVTESGSATIQTMTAGFDPVSDSSTTDSAKVSAKIEEIYVKAGQQVSEGDPIAKLTTTGLADILDGLQTDLQKAQLSLNQAQVDRELSAVTAENTYRQNQSKSSTAELQYELTLKQIENELASSQLSLKELEEQMEEYEDQVNGEIGEDYNLESLEEAWDNAYANYVEAQQEATIGSSGGSSSSVDSAKQKVVSAREAYQNAVEQYDDAVEEAKKQLRSLKNQYEAKLLEHETTQAGKTLDEITAEAQKEEDLTTAENSERLYQVELAQLENNVATQALSVQEIQKQIEEYSQYANSDGMILAPCSGLVTSVNYDVGDSVSWDAEIASVSNLDNVYVGVSISQDDIASISIGKQADVSFSAYEDSAFSATVDSITVTPSMSGASTVSYYVKVKLDDGQDVSKIYEGMTGDVTFVTREARDVISVSSRAVVNEDGTEYVLVKSADGAPEKREVTTGFSDGRNVEIISGLEEGETALIENQVAASQNKKS